MRRIVFAVCLAALSLYGAGTAARPAAHAQAATLAVSVSPATVTTGSSTVVSGTGFTPNDYAYVYYQRPDGTYNAFYLSTSPGGTFSFPLGFLAVHGAGTEYVSAYDYATARWAPFATVMVTLATPAPHPLVLSAAPATVRAGTSTTISGTGFTPNQYVYVYWQRPDSTAGSTFAYTGSSGTFSFTLQFLTTHGTGTERIQAYDYGSRAYSAAITVTVTS